MKEETPASDQPIMEVLEDCQNWLSAALSSLFYAENDQTDTSLPAVYRDWLNNPETGNAFQKVLLDQVGHSAETLIAAFSKAKESLPPVKADFDQFMQAYEDFMARLNHVENDSLLSGHGIDSLTGFKANSVLEVEIKRELERRSRRGNPFSVAMLRIDGSTSPEEKDFKLKTMATALRQCIRSFDDVYRMGETDLLVGLKHSDLKGGMRFIDRLKAELKALQADFTFSSCVAEPDPADDLSALLKNLEADLSQIAAYGGGQSVRYEELSPLQRFVSSMKDNK